MSGFFRNFLQTHTPSVISKRFRGKINIQRPRPPHYERARVLAVTQPIYKQKPVRTHIFQGNRDHFQVHISIGVHFGNFIYKSPVGQFNHKCSHRNSDPQGVSLDHSTGFHLAQANSRTAADFRKDALSSSSDHFAIKLFTI